jgi:hypothetical protein
MQPGEVLVWRSNTVYHAAFHCGDTPYTRESLDMRIMVRTILQIVLRTVSSYTFTLSVVSLSVQGQSVCLCPTVGVISDALYRGLCSIVLHICLHLRSKGHYT